MTLKTEIMMLKIQFAITGINYIIKYIQIKKNFIYRSGLQTATKTVAFATKNINLRVKFLLRSPLATIYIYML